MLAPMASDPRKDYLALVDELTEHDRRYYVEANPTISDSEYDQLNQRLRAIEADHPDWVVEWSPTRRVGHAPVSDFPKVERPVAMLSLDNTYDEAELKAFFDRVVKGLDGDVPVFSVEPKIDGEVKWKETAVTHMQLKSFIARVTRDGSRHKVLGVVLNDVP